MRFLGVRDDIPTVLNAMDVFLFPSHIEGLDISALEAQAAGCLAWCPTASRHWQSHLLKPRRSRLRKAQKIDR